MWAVREERLQEVDASGAPVGRRRVRREPVLLTFERLACLSEGLARVRGGGFVARAMCSCRADWAIFKVRRLDLITLSGFGGHSRRNSGTGRGLAKVVERRVECCRAGVGPACA
jgi:hypothetical protein